MEDMETHASDAPRLVRCDEIGEGHEPHPWTDDEFPGRRMWCLGVPVKD